MKEFKEASNTALLEDGEMYLFGVTEVEITKSTFAKSFEDKKTKERKFVLDKEGNKIFENQIQITFLSCDDKLEEPVELREWIPAKIWKDHIKSGKDHKGVRLLKGFGILKAVEAKFGGFELEEGDEKLLLPLFAGKTAHCLIKDKVSDDGKLLKKIESYIRVDKTAKPASKTAAKKTKSEPTEVVSETVGEDTEEDF
jgi:hypothetical protein